MVNSILTPVTLWKDFDDSLPLNVELIRERAIKGAIVQEIFFEGRQTQKGRVKIYAQYIRPAGLHEFPTVMVFFEAGFPADMQFVSRLSSRGYGVLCVDYCGENGTENHTVYPEDVAYANYARAGRALDFAEPTAKETSWYEWAGVARYAARFLEKRPEVTKYGAIGMRTGGEVLFKVAPYAGFSCFISVCAAGWLAYRGIEKFADEKQRTFDEERHRFIAGVDSQSYAPYVACPVLLISAINDKKYNYDRVYDTFNQINPAVEKAILFSAHGSGLVGRHSLENIDLFLDKYLRGRSVFISAPVGFSVDEDEKGNLAVKAKFDPAGEIVDCGYFFSEKVTAFKARDWTRVLCRDEQLRDNEAVIPLGVYEKCDKVLLYTFARYSNGFSVTSKIQEISIKKRYKNSAPKARVIFSGTDGLNGFSVLRTRARSIADCFADGSSTLNLKAGYGGILGATSQSGLITYRVSEPRYKAPEGASLSFDAYCAEDATVILTFYTDDEEKNGYTGSVKIAGGGKWKSVVMGAEDFKSEMGAPLGDFNGVVSLVFLLEKETVVNNVIWL